MLVTCFSCSFTSDILSKEHIILYIQNKNCKLMLTISYKLFSYQAGMHVIHICPCIHSFLACTCSRFICCMMFPAQKQELWTSSTGFPCDNVHFSMSFTCSKSGCDIIYKDGSISSNLDLKTYNWISLWHCSHYAYLIRKQILFF